MKLRQRGVVTLGVSSLAVTFCTFYMVSNQLHRAFVDKDENYVAKELARRGYHSNRADNQGNSNQEYFVDKNEDDETLVDTGNHDNNVKNHGNREDSFGQSIGILQEHLQIMRKELEKSEYNDTKTRSVRVKAFLEGHPVLQLYAGDILDLAQAIREDTIDQPSGDKDKSEHLVSHSNIPKEHLKGNDEFRMAGPLYKSFVSGNSSRDFVDPVTDEMREYLETQLKTVKYKKPSRTDKPLITRLRVHTVR